MKRAALYEVCGRRTFRGHVPGTRFEGVIDRNAENRAINRGDIRVIKRFTPSIQPEHLTRGWLSKQEEEVL